MKKNGFIELRDYHEYPVAEMTRRSEAFLAEMKCRRSVRQFSTRPVPLSVIDNCLATAGTAPSGANMQPWHFVVVSDPEIKKKIRVAAEKVESDFYHRRAPEYWLKELEHLGTDEHKPYLENAPYLIAIFTVRHTVADDGTIRKHYYLPESMGIATGMLITAIHHAGLVCLTHTPQPMSFLTDLLNRPKTEKPFLLLAVGYPETGTMVPDINKKSLDEITTYM